MAALPGFRVRKAHPFSIVGIDYAGLLQMKELSLRKARIVKVYIAVFVCMTTKAVHLQPVSALSTEAFLLTLDRFVARRGLPSSIYSDCGTNFVGALRQLRLLVNSPDSRDQLSGHIACEWHFNPPGAPHFGGIWEAAVKSAKSLPVHAMDSQIWTLEEFTTVLCRVEAALNLRPLVPASSDPNDLECLTPGHFLIGRPLLSIPEPISTSAQVSLQTRWKLLQQSFQFFWRRWSREYLNTLQARGRWTKTDTNLVVGTMVIVKVNDAPPLSWPLGRIIEVYPGTDKVTVNNVVPLLKPDHCSGLLNCSVRPAHSTAPFDLLIQLFRSTCSTVPFKWSLVLPPISWLIEVSVASSLELARGSMFDPFDNKLPPSVATLC
ncbi:uncharacterized protein LOC132940289 [Metopolophium dirhodum]|uniref:uncharacterized protein LOC132940289 n=1 Tax=Metopolophium dirhodum TaxID=44670 RepID=UPI00298FB14D|nr:uncharacterized protein LOC132940289 [Metopolophium dirhodum]